MHVKLDELVGMKVFDANGRVVGRVKAALVDMETWLVDTLRIGVDRHAAEDLDKSWPIWAFWRRPTIDVSTGQINAAGDAVILRVAIAELREAPHLPAEVLVAVH